MTILDRTSPVYSGFKDFNMCVLTWFLGLVQKAKRNSSICGCKRGGVHSGAWEEREQARQVEQSLRQVRRLLRSR